MVLKILFLTLMTTILLHNANAVSPRSRIYPCKVKDYACIRRVLAANSYCDPRVVGSVPDRVTQINQVIDAPFFNATYEDQTEDVSNIRNCSVAAFYLDIPKYVYVLALQCINLNITSKRRVIQHVPLEPDQNYLFTINGVYGKVIYTMVFPNPRDLDICKQEAYPDVSLPSYKIFNADPATQQYLKRGGNGLAVNGLAYVLELFYGRLSQLFRFIVNGLICDYKCL